MNERLRVFLVDDHDVARAGARHYLEERFDIVGEADNAIDAAEMIPDRNPDIVLLDVRLPGGGGTYVVEQVRRVAPSVRFLAFTVSAERNDVLRLLQAGVDGYVTKATFGPDLPDLVYGAATGQRPVSADVAGFLLDIDAGIVEAAGIEKLAPREHDVVNLIACGYTYRETAARMEISVKTLETHLRHIFDKLGVASRQSPVASRQSPVAMRCRELPTRRGSCVPMTKRAIRVNPDSGNGSDQSPWFRARAAAQLTALEAARTRYSRERGERTASPNRLGVNSQESAG